MKTGIALCFLPLMACEPTAYDTHSDTTAPRAPGTAVVLKAAGYTVDMGAPDDPDAISEATSAAWNTHVFVDLLVAKLQARSVDAQVADWVDCKDLACLRVPDEGSTADIAVFAGPTYYGVLPDQIRDLAPALGELEPAPGTCSAIASYETAGEYAVASFLEELEERGLGTVEGAALHAGTSQTEGEVDAALEALVGRLMGG